MSEDPIKSGDSVNRNHAATKTAGSILRAAREREGLHVAALAVSMKVPVKKLEALESDRLDLLPDAVFVRALAASVCRALKLDPASVLELLPTSAPPKLRLEGRGINAPFDAPRHSGTTTFKDAFSKPTVVIVGLLLFAAAAVYFVPAVTQESTHLEVNSDLGGSRAVPNAEAVTAAVTQALPASEIQGDIKFDSVSGQSQPTPSSASATTLDSTPAVAAQVAAATPAAGQLANAPPHVTVSDPIISFKAKGAAWVQVTDAKGGQLISRTLAAGESVGLSGSLPLAVIVGRSDLTVVEVRGKSFDMNNFSQNNVARFEIKQ